MRLIDADAFKNYIREACEVNANLFKDGGELARAVTESFCKDIDEQPTIEVPEWIEIYEGQENLPPLGVDVLLCVINGSEDVGFLIKDEEGLKWKVGTWYNDFLEWDAWRYLPEAWKGGMSE